MCELKLSVNCLMVSLLGSPSFFLTLSVILLTLSGVHCVFKCRV